ncbi:hypothetical protein GW17_00016064 [Ensete ventricosum]|nr:hypothetical protein GW17_00016064 [Ensete ventricosum]
MIDESGACSTSGSVGLDASKMLTTCRVGGPQRTPMLVVAKLPTVTRVVVGSLVRLFGVEAGQQPALCRLVLALARYVWTESSEMERPSFRIWERLLEFRTERQQPPAILRWTPRASGDADAAVPSLSSVDTAGPGDSAEKNPAGYSSQLFVF